MKLTIKRPDDPETPITENETQEAPRKAVDESPIVKLLKKDGDRARQTFKDPKQLEIFLHELERKLKIFPTVGKSLSKIPTLIEMLRCHNRGVYDGLSLSTLVTIVVAVAYYLLPSDMLSEFLPGIGEMDNTDLMTGLMEMIDEELEAFKLWRDTRREEEEAQKAAEAPEEAAPAEPPTSEAE